MTDDLVRAQSEHDQAAREVEAAIPAVDVIAWHLPRAQRIWSPADEIAHVLLAYDFGTRAAKGTMVMQQRRPAWVSALTRHVLLPTLLQRAQFPTGGVSPEELDPRQRTSFREHVTTRESAVDAITCAAAEVKQAFLHALDTAPDRRIVHAYFGGLSLLLGWRLLSAHTRHHARLLNLETSPLRPVHAAPGQAPTDPR